MLTDAENLRLFGHLALVGGEVCGHENAFFGIRSAATVQLREASGAASARPCTSTASATTRSARPCRFAPHSNSTCNAKATPRSLAVPASPDPAGYVASLPIELSHDIANSRPQLVRMVANGAEGNIRGADGRAG